MQVYGELASRRHHGWIERNGCILHTGRYEDCVRFYRDIVGLRLEFEKNEPAQTLTILDFGGAYLMIERGGLASAAPKTAAQNPVTIRFNVVDIDEAVAQLRSKGLNVHASCFEWRTIADFTDPDGNPCQLREAASFAR